MKSFKEFIMESNIEEEPIINIGDLVIIDVLDGYYSRRHIDISKVYKVRSIETIDPDDDESYQIFYLDIPGFHGISNGFYRGELKLVQKAGPDTDQIKNILDNI